MRPNPTVDLISHTVDIDKPQRIYKIYFLFDEKTEMSSRISNLSSKKEIFHILSYEFIK